MAAQVGIAGSSRIGKNCMFGGQVGVAGHIMVADGVKATAMAGIGSSVRNKDSIVMGAPAYEISEFKKTYMAQRRLPALNQRVVELEKELKKLKEKLS